MRDFVILALLMTTFACASMRPVVVSVVPDVAAEAHARAQELARASSFDERGEDRAKAREALEQAIAAAPDWVAPRRLVDDLMREELLGLEALTAHQERLDEAPSDAAALYLAGRLEGDSTKRFEKAAAADPELAWAHHGLAYGASRSGRNGDAIRHGRRALERARDPWERAFFKSALAIYYGAAGNTKTAVTILEDALRDEAVLDGQRIGLRVQLATTELEFLSRPERMRGYRRALELIRRERLTERELTSLVTSVRRFSVTGGVNLLELQTALAEQRGHVRDQLRAQLMLEESPTPLALALLENALEERGELENGGSLLRRARFAAGQFPEAIERWLEGLPRVVLDDFGVPKDEHLAQVVLAARRLGADGLGDVERLALLTHLGQATIDAGWFIEARSVATQLAAYDLDLALELEARSLSGLELLQGLRRLVYRTDDDAEGAGSLASSSGMDEEPLDLPEGSEIDAVSVAKLKDLLGAMGPLFARAHERLGGDANAEAVREQIIDSPKLDYGFIGALVHPGPNFSSEDEKLGRGERGKPVGGLAKELEEIGRFAIFGQVVGSPPDGAILRRLLVEPASGKHLGVRWTGTIAWCEGADVLARAGRLGAQIGGAALHEGYWVDIEVLRRELTVWNQLTRKFSAAGMRSRVDDVLATRGVPLNGDDKNRSRLRRQRRSAEALLGEAERVRLAVLRDRAKDFETLGRMTLDELVETTSVHEQGHLCDRERYLPILRNLDKVSKLLFQGSFSPHGVQKRLEYRAQLLAMCEVTDPRLPLSDVLAAAEGGGSVTPHASAYADLLEDLLLYLDRLLESEPELWTEIDPAHTLVHQLHWLGPEKVRRLARKLAEKRDLVD